MENMMQCLKRYGRPEKRNGEVWVEISKNKIKSAMLDLKQTGADRVSAITGLDAGKDLGVIYHLLFRGVVVNVRVRVDKRSHTVDTITDIFPGVSLFERELMEMLGIHVKGHPDPRKLFLSGESPSCPLRKDKQ